MFFSLQNGKVLSLTRQGVNAELPLIRKDSKAYCITETLWGIYTPSTGMPGALMIGPKEDCEEAIRQYGTH